LKVVLSDPEWLDDPDSKATQVAMECLREMRGGRQVLAGIAARYGDSEGAAAPFGLRTGATQS
jgi:hypothetical protein